LGFIIKTIEYEGLVVPHHYLCSATIPAQSDVFATSATS